jgi:hypothetical protein
MKLQEIIFKAPNNKIEAKGIAFVVFEKAGCPAPLLFRWELR